jgi:hypothetical protein
MASRSHDGDLDGDGYDQYDDDGFDDDVDDDFDDDFDDEPTRGAPVRRSIGDRVRAGAQSRSTGRSGSTNRPAPTRSTKQIVERLDDRERLLCFAASALAVVVGVLIYVVETENKHFHVKRGELHPQTTLVLGLVVGALLLGATLLGRRAPVGFVALFGFLFFGTQYLAGIPFLVLAVWLLVRSYKFQKEAAATRKASIAAGETSARAGPRGTRGTGASTGSAKSRAARSTAKGTTTKGSAAAEANKRYTPKRPAPPPPKPSRRDRKAAQASD